MQETTNFIYNYGWNKDNHLQKLQQWHKASVWN